MSGIHQINCGDLPGEEINSEVVDNADKSTISLPSIMMGKSRGRGILCNRHPFSLFLAHYSILKKVYHFT